MSVINGNINAALILIERAIEALSVEGLQCDRCGEDLDLSETDVLDDITAAKEELLALIKRNGQ